MVEDYRDPDVLRRLYYDEGLTLYEMSKRLYVCNSTLCKWFHKHGLQVDYHRQGMKPVYRILIDGHEITVPEACRKYGLNSRVVYYRLSNGERGPEVVRPAKRTGRPKGGRK